MSAEIRALMMALPLLLAAVAGSLYTPAPGQSQDASPPAPILPPLPSWATAPLPDFSLIRDTTEKKAAFFSFLYPRVVLANSRVLLQRQHLLRLSDKARLTPADVQWLETQAEGFGIEDQDDSLQLLEQLGTRLDMIPPSLVLAQAANESAWGTSRFATGGNNLFGQWCFSEGCGMVPLNRSQGAAHEVRVFRSVYHSVEAYIQNLNTHPAYRLLRNIRQQQRQAGEPLSGLALARGLLGYSSRGENYVKEIQTIIRHNNLEFYDNHFRTLIRGMDDQGLRLLVTHSDESRMIPGRPRTDDPAPNINPQ